MLMSYVLELFELVVGDLMCLCDYLCVFCDGMGLDEVMVEFVESCYSCYLWFDCDGEEVLGILYMKDLLVEIVCGKLIGDLCFLLCFVNLIVLEILVLLVLECFCIGIIYLVLCVEEYGCILGYFILEDLFEVVVGDIEDEYLYIVKDVFICGVDGILLVVGLILIFCLEWLLGYDLDVFEYLNLVGGLIVY